MIADKNQFLLPLGDVPWRLPKSSQMMIEDTLAVFDFLHVSLVIEAMGFYRVFVEDNEETPSTETLRSRATNLLIQALREKDPNAEFRNGGLRAVWRSDDVLALTYEIEFSHGWRQQA